MDDSLRAIESAQECLLSASKAAMHVHAELGRQVDEIMGTISKGDVFWVHFETAGGLVPEGTAQGVVCNVLNTHAEAEAYYTQWVAAVVDLKRVAHVRDLVTDWYVFFESIFYGLDLQSNRDIRGQHVVLLPTRRDGIAGEMLWPRYLYMSTDDHAVEPAPEDERTPIERCLELTEGFLQALRRNDSAAVASMFRAKAFGALPRLSARGTEKVSCTTRQEIGDYYESLFTDYVIDDVQVISRMCDSWYAFMDLLVTVTPRDAASVGHFELRMATILGIGAEGVLAGQLACRTELITVGAPPPAP